MSQPQYEPKWADDSVPLEADEMFHEKAERYDPSTIVMRHLQKILDLSFEDMSPPSMNVVATPKGNKLIKSGDNRIRMINAIRFLKAFIKPYFDEIMIKDYENYLTELKKAEGYYWSLYVNTKRGLEKSKTSRSAIKSVPQDEDSPLYDATIEDKFNIHYELFEKMCELLVGRLEGLKEKAYEE